MVSSAANSVSECAVLCGVVGIMKHVFFDAVVICGCNDVVRSGLHVYVMACVAIEFGSTGNGARHGLRPCCRCFTDVIQGCRPSLKMPR